jgi:hypothetical protein
MALAFAVRSVDRCGGSVHVTAVELELEAIGQVVLVHAIGLLEQHLVAVTAWTTPLFT